MNLLALTTGGIIGIVVAVVVVLAIIIWVIATRNKLVTLENDTEGAFHNIDVYLKKRYDLIPNIVETVKGYAKHESETFEKVVKARNTAITASTTEEKIQAENELTRCIRGLNLVVEQYPELKANTGFLDLQNQLRAIENELANSRKYFNATVEQFNTKIRIFPTSLIASAMKLKKLPYFELESDQERQNVKVQF